MNSDKRFNPSPQYIENLIDFMKYAYDTMPPPIKPGEDDKLAFRKHLDHLKETRLEYLIERFGNVGGDQS